MRIGSRGSALALAQAEQVASLLGGAEIVRITTAGDLGQAEVGGAPAERADAEGMAAGLRGVSAAAPVDGAAVRPGTAGPGPAGSAPAPAADKSRWVDAIERALLDGEIDLAVHSAKDLPGELPSGLALLGTPPRAPAEDVICGAPAIAQLPRGAAIGTGSLRRRSQLLAVRPDLVVSQLAGNVDTRLGRLRLSGGPAGRQDGGDAPSLAAVILARAGLMRLGRTREIGGVLDPARHVPSPGQGALALEGRDGDGEVATAVAAITDPDAFACLRAERALARALQADCHTPLGAHAQRAASSMLLLRAWIGLPDGSEWIADAQEGESSDPDGLGTRVAQRLQAVGAAEMLARAREMAAWAQDAVL